jgi:hypothetical protein
MISGEISPRPDISDARYLVDNKDQLDSAPRSWQLSVISLAPKASVKPRDKDFRT